MAVRVRLFNSAHNRLRCSRAGLALVVHERGAENDALLDYAAQRAAEPGHTVVVVDVGPNIPLEAFEDVAGELGASPGVLRLIFRRPDSRAMIALGSWLADRCHRTVLTPGGPTVAVVGGGLFVPPAGGAGWLRFEAGRGPFEHSRRFPLPLWECPPFAEPRPLGHDAVLEPTPAGAWIHPGGEPGAVDGYRRWLVGGLLPDARLPRIVLGYPGSPVTPLTAVAEFWRALPESLHPEIRFALLGRLDETAAPFGQQLADAVGSPVIVDTGVPSIAPDASGAMHAYTLLPQGTMAWAPYVNELGYYPSGAGGNPAVPVADRAPPADSRADRAHTRSVRVRARRGARGDPQRSVDAPVGRASPTPRRFATRRRSRTRSRSCSTRAPGRSAGEMLRLAREAIGRLEPQVRALVTLLASSGAAGMHYLEPVSPTTADLLAPAFGFEAQQAAVAAEPVPAALPAAQAPDAARPGLPQQPSLVTQPPQAASGQQDPVVQGPVVLDAVVLNAVVQDPAIRASGQPGPQSPDAVPRNLLIQSGVPAGPAAHPAAPYTPGRVGVGRDSRRGGGRGHRTGPRPGRRWHEQSAGDRADRRGCPGGVGRCADDGAGDTAALRFAPGQRDRHAVGARSDRERRAPATSPRPRPRPRRITRPTWPSRLPHRPRKLNRHRPWKLNRNRNLNRNVNRNRNLN